MVGSKTLTDTLKLGAELAKEISAQTEENLTGQWIAQYLAERLQAAEKDPSIRPECADLILRLWASRRNYPTGDPLKEYAAAALALKKIGSGAPRYFGNHFNHQLQDPDTESPYLQAAIQLDEASSYIIAHLINLAAEATADNEGKGELIDLASKVAIDIEIEFAGDYHLLGLTREEEAVPEDSAERYVEQIRSVLQFMENNKNARHKS